MAMTNINMVILSGNLTRDGEIRTGASGMSVLTCGLAYNDGKRNAETGEWEDIPNFIDLVFFGTRADALASHMKKGQKVTVTGKLRWSQWDAKDGSGKRSKHQVYVNHLEFGSPKPAGGAEVSVPDEVEEPAVLDIDIPF